MHPGRARLLREARDGGLDLLALLHHQVRELVDHDDDPRQLLRQRRDALVAPLLGRDLVGQAVVVLRDDDLRVRVLRLAARDALDPRVVRGDVLRARVGEELVAALHLVDRPLERRRRLLHVGDDRQQHVRDAIEGRELDDLRIDHESRSSSGERR